MDRSDAPTFDGVLSLAQRLAPADKLRLIARLVSQLEQLVGEAPTSSAQVLLDLSVAWVGDDFTERLAEVYTARRPLSN